MYNISNNIWEIIFDLHNKNSNFIISGGIADNINYSNLGVKNLLETTDIDIVFTNINDLYMILEYVKLNFEENVIFFGFFGKIPMWAIRYNDIRIDMALDDNYDNDQVNNIVIKDYNLKYLNSNIRLANLKYILDFAYMDKENKIRNLRNDKILKYFKKLVIYKKLVNNEI